MNYFTISALRQMFTLSILCISLASYGQSGTSNQQAESKHSSVGNHPCGTAPMTPQQRKYTLQVVDKAGGQFKNAGTTCIPMRIHIVTEDDGTGGVNMGDVNAGIANLNNFYKQAGIEFYIGAVNIIMNSGWYDFDETEQAALTMANSIYDAPNVYFVKEISVGIAGKACGYAFFPANTTSSLDIMMANECVINAPNGTFVHEFGHFFNLGHTHEGTENGNMDPMAENVARTGANANCSTNGDMLCDTQADPQGTNNAACMFNNDGASPNDQFGMTYTPDINNIMSYYDDECGGIFTPQQYARIINGLATRQSHTNYNLTGLAPNTVNDPTDLTATLNMSNEVVLNWTDNAANEIGYLIERSSDAGATWTALIGGGVNMNITTYTDNSVVMGTNYQYRVKATNDDCNHYSEPASVDMGVSPIPTVGQWGLLILALIMMSLGLSTFLISKTKSELS